MTNYIYLISPCTKYKIIIINYPKYVPNCADMSKYRLFNLQCNPNYYTWTPSCWNNEINGNIKFLQPYSTVAADVLLEISMVKVSAVLSLSEHLSDKHFQCHKILLLVSVVFQFFLVSTQFFPVRIHTANCFMNSIQKFWCNMMFQQWT
jgi:hypothetical protein